MLPPSFTIYVWWAVAATAAIAAAINITTYTETHEHFCGIIGIVEILRFCFVGFFCVRIAAGISEGGEYRNECTPSMLCY